ncbi:MAG: hypothetical protein HRU20_26980 [Pseudomonadales bacterium]|nr:hypothetical protein [Pseudomonadales bacterium]
MIELTLELYLSVAIALLIVIWGISIFCFTRISLKHIENEMAKEGLLPPVYDKGLGGRIAPYSMVILFPNIKRHASLIDVEATLRHSRKIDWYLSLFLNISFYTLFVLMIVSCFIFDPVS